MPPSRRSMSSTDRPVLLRHALCVDDNDIGGDRFERLRSPYGDDDRTEHGWAARRRRMPRAQPR
jgi:hypothetical protein